LDRQNKKTPATVKRHYVTIQRNTATTDGEGGYEGAWSDLMSIWAAVDPIQARQVFTYRSIGVDASHLIRIDGLVDIAETDRISFDNRFFEILAIEDIQERGFEKVITCKETRPHK
jgi:SPP1 family predicted phage head-tail adaptor